VHEALLEMAGFAKTDDHPPVVESDKTEAVEPDAKADAQAEMAQPAEDKATEDKAADDSSQPETPKKYWRWKGMGKARSTNHRKHQGKKSAHRKKSNKSGSHSRKAEPVLASAGGAFAELAALKEAMKK
jgi:ATP-dependent RNA helicase SUPV3L1/SUV3